MVAAQGTQPVRSSWEVDCEHSVDDLVRRIPLRHLQALDRDAGHTPIFLSKNFRSNRACFVPRCFRAVVDDFASREETHALWSHLEPQYGRPHAEEVTRGRSSHTTGEHFIGITAAMFPAGLLHNITSRMAAYLEQEHGARGLYVSHTNSRGEWRFYQNASRGREAARRRQAELIEGRSRGDRGEIEGGGETAAGGADRGETRQARTHRCGTPDDMALHVLALHWGARAGALRRRRDSVD